MAIYRLWHKDAPISLTSYDFCRVQLSRKFSREATSYWPRTPALGRRWHTCCLWCDPCPPSHAVTHTKYIPVVSLRCFYQEY